VGRLPDNLAEKRLVGLPTCGGLFKGGMEGGILYRLKDEIPCKTSQNLPQDITRERPIFRATIRARRDALQRDFMPGLGKRERGY